MHRLIMGLMLTLLWVPTVWADVGMTDWEVAQIEPVRQDESSRGGERPVLSREVYLGVFKTTGYTDWDAGMDGRGITRSGERTRYGCVSVDPSVVPLWTRLHIEGRGGVHTALDTGGGVLGRHIDIWFPTKALAFEWGVRYVDVWMVTE
jgi:3D (Asp-Asp-Asp) domain-containing protein